MDSVQSDGDVVQALKTWREYQENEGVRIGELVGYCGGVLSFLRSSR